MKSSLAGLMVALLVAGCTDPAEVDRTGTIDGALDGLPGPDLPDLGFDFDAGVRAPTWEIGDWWSYKITYTSGETYDAKIIVYDADGSNYYVTADDRDLILRAAITHYPTFGAVAKSDQGQSIHGTDVDYLRFPMKNGTWTGTYRDFEAAWTTGFAELDTGKGKVPGFATTMRHTGDGQVRMSHGWSPVTKWFTNLTFDFDGYAPPDVTYELQDWGSNHTGTFPVLEIIDGVHRMFPAYPVSPPDAADPPDPPSGSPEATATFEIGAEGSSLLWAIFAGAGGPGDFEFRLGHMESQASHDLSWRPNAAGQHFDWGEFTGVASGEWGVTGIGAAQGFAFLFLEAYEVRSQQATLP